MVRLESGEHTLIDMVLTVVQSPMLIYRWMQDASACIDGIMIELAGQKRTSSGFWPPELASAVICEEAGGSKAQVLASQAIDMWQFGVNAKRLRSGSKSIVVIVVGLAGAALPIMQWVLSIWNGDQPVNALKSLLNANWQDVQENVEEWELQDIADWTDQHKTEKLARIGKGWPRRLVSTLLNYEPEGPPRSWDYVLKQLGADRNAAATSSDAIDVKSCSVNHLAEVSMKDCDTALQLCLESSDMDWLWAQKGKIKNVEEATIWHMVNGHVKQYTEEHKTSYVDALDGEDHVGEATVLLSYSWVERYHQVFEALGDWTRKKGNARDPKRTHVWVCSLCLNREC